jgi:tryptophan-rich sensory protein
MLVRTIIFLIINFGALALGSYFTGKGVIGEWYETINKAPWTPPGWVFGVAWTLIMVCFSIYMAYLWKLHENKTLIISAFILQFFLNVIWNPVFFYHNNALLGLVVILALTLLVWWFLLQFSPQLKLKSLLLLPYAVWLIIASSLNAYIWFMN